jgi:hypothetical protein
MGATVFFMVLSTAQVEARLPQDVRDALDDLYTPERRQKWLTSYATVCPRRRKAMVYLTLKEAGYPTSGYT